MPLTPEVRAFLESPAARRLAFPPGAESDPALAADYLRRARAALAGPPPAAQPGPAGPGPVAEPVARVRDTRVPGGPPVRLYLPDAPAPRPLLVYFHGGGWVLGGLDMHDATCRRLAGLLGASVVNVDYRLAPEHRFPAALDDCQRATEWALGAATELGGDLARLVVAGSSSGGNLAAAVALRARDTHLPLAAQVLVYPVLDARLAEESHCRYGEGHLLETRQLAWYWEQYVPDARDRCAPYASPSATADLAGLPPAVVLTAEYDPLRDEGERYAARLADAGVPVRCTRQPGQVHGFLTMPGLFPDADTALAGLAADLTDLLALADPVRGAR